MAIGGFGAGIGASASRGYGDPMGNAFGPMVDLGLSNGLQGNINPGTGALTFAGEAFGLPGGYVSIDPNTGSMTAHLDTPSGQVVSMDLNSALALAGDGTVAPGMGSSARGLNFGLDRPMDPAALQSASTGFGFGPVSPPSFGGVISPPSLDEAINLAPLDPAAPTAGFLGFAPSGSLESTISGMMEGVANAARAADLNPSPENMAALEAMQGELASAIAALDAADTPSAPEGFPGVAMAVSTPGLSTPGGDEISLDPASREGIEKGLQDLGHGRGFNGIEGTQTNAERAAALGLGSGRSNLGGPLGDDEEGQNAFSDPVGGYGSAAELAPGSDAIAPELATDIQGLADLTSARDAAQKDLEAMQSRGDDLAAEIAAIAADQELVSGLEGFMDARDAVAAAREAGSERAGSFARDAIGIAALGLDKEAEARDARASAFATDDGSAPNAFGGPSDLDMAMGDAVGMGLDGVSQGGMSGPAFGGGASDLDMAMGDAVGMGLDGAMGGNSMGDGRGFDLSSDAVSGGMDFGNGLDGSGGRESAIGGSGDPGSGSGFAGLDGGFTDGTSNDMSGSRESSTAVAGWGGGGDEGGSGGGYGGGRGGNSSSGSGGYGGSLSGGSPMDPGGWGENAFGSFDRGADLDIDGMDLDLGMDFGGMGWG